MKIKIIIISQFLLLNFLGRSAAQEPDIYPTVQTISFLTPDKEVVLTKQQRKDLAARVSRTLNLNNKQLREDLDPGGGIRFTKRILNPAVDFVIDRFAAIDPTPAKWGSGLLKLGAKFRDDHLKSLEEENSVFKVDNLFQKSQAANSYFSELRRLCDNNLDCINREAEKIINNPKVKREIANDLSVFTDATVKQLIIASAQNSTDLISERFDNFEVLAQAGFDQVTTQLSEVQATQNKLVKNTAKVIQIQQEHTIALAEIQKTIQTNQEEIKKRLDQGFGDVMALQQQNLLLTSTVLENTEQMGLKLDTIAGKLNIVQQRQLEQIFDNAPTAKKLALLKGNEGIELFKDNPAERIRQIENFEKLLRIEQVIAVTQKVREWGMVGKQAISVLCPNCPEKLSESIDFAITVSDIVGSAVTGNWSQAIQTGLSVFSSPKPGPELIMLKQISAQLKGLESQMNDRFDEVHKHLFAIEDNLVSRLEIVDEKLNGISDQIQFIYSELSSQLSKIDSKLNYITRQNDCTQDLIIEIFRNQNTDICKGPVRDFKDLLEKGQIKNFDSLNSFFIGHQCKPCIEALFNVSNSMLKESRIFQYSDCKTVGGTNNNRPDKLYEFVFNNLISNSQKVNPLARYSFLILPNNVITASTILDTLAKLPDSIKSKIGKYIQQLNFNPNDKFYKNYQAVIDFTNYMLTMFPFVELYNDGKLMRLQDFKENPGTSKSRSQALVRLLQDLLDVIDRTIFQESIMTGMGTFKAVDNFIKNKLLTNEDAGADLQNLFQYNPNFNQNYAAYFIYKQYGLKSLNRIFDAKKLENGTDIRFGAGFKSVLSKNEKGQYIISVTTEDGSIRIFDAILPTNNSKIDSLIFYQFLSYSLPKSIIELLEAKNKITALKGELEFILSDSFDKKNSFLINRNDLNILIQESKHL